MTPPNHRYAENRNEKACWNCKHIEIDNGWLDCGKYSHYDTDRKMICDVWESF
jgi:hypothetical protein